MVSTDAVSCCDCLQVSKWVSKKVADLLGAEEPDLVAFIMSLLDSRSTPQKVGTEAAACHATHTPLRAPQ